MVKEENGTPAASETHHRLTVQLQVGDKPRFTNARVPIYTVLQAFKFLMYKSKNHRVVWVGRDL